MMLSVGKKDVLVAKSLFSYIFFVSAIQESVAFPQSMELISLLLFSFFLIQYQRGISNFEKG